MPSFLFLLALIPFPFAHAEKVELQLLTMGPGSHVYMSGGHAALMAVRHDAKGVPSTQVYNYGNADFEDPWLPLDFARGRAEFFFNSPGDLAYMVRKYGMAEKRFIYRQPLNLTPKQVRQAVLQLETKVLPQNRSYAHHHLEANCVSAMRDFLNEISDGEIHRQLAGSRDPDTVRAIQWQVFSSHPFVAFISDLFFGRLHDRPIDQYFAILEPVRLREQLQTVRMPGGQGLAGAPITIIEIPGEEPPGVSTVSRIFSVLFFSFFFLVAGAATLAKRGWPVRVLGGTLLGWSAFSTLVGVGYLFFFLFSSMKETHSNELMGVFIVTDLCLLIPAWRLFRSGVLASPHRFITFYIRLRFLLLSLLCVGRMAGVLIQQPGSLTWMAWGVFLSLILAALPAPHWSRIRRMGLSRV